MYLEHFKFKELPFTLTPSLQFFCQLKGCHEALNTLLFCLRSGEGFIKIIAEVGSGKTLLCRKLLDSLGPEFFTAYIPNPDLNPAEFRKAFARELGIDPLQTNDSYELLSLINRALMDLHVQGKRVVLLLDEAQALPTESLEALRLLTNLETETCKLLQVILFAQPELDERLQSSDLRQLKQRITFSYYLPVLSRQELDTYLFHRLAIAGYTQGALFTKKAKDMLYRASKGVPRIINILCHKALLIAYAKGESKVMHTAISHAINDTEKNDSTTQSNWQIILVLIGLGIIVSAVFGFYVYKGIV
jgi:MSHA biogenesis protein MshM